MPVCESPTAESATSKVCRKKKSAESPRPTTPTRAIILRRSPFNQTVRASQRNVTRLKMESAMTIVCTMRPGSSQIAESIVSFFYFSLIEWNPFTTTILHQCHAVFIPYNHTIECVDQRSSGARHLIIDGIFAQAPGGIDASVGAAHGTFVMQIQAGRNLLVGHTLRHQFRHTQLIGFQQGTWRLLIQAAHFLHPVFNFRINQAASIDGITQ